jgi:hypothetical protein
MDDENKQKHREQVVKGQMNRDDMREAFRSHYKAVANDDRFNELLKRLHDKETGE